MENRIEKYITANGERVAVKVPCTIEEFLLEHNFFPKSVVVEHNGEAVSPSEFNKRIIKEGDKLEIVKVVAGG